MTNNEYNEQEYVTLRNEIIKRIEIRQQLIFSTLTLSGVIMGFGINVGKLSFIFPPLAFSLSLMWAQNDLRALQIGDYLKLFENDTTKLGWINYYQQLQGRSSFNLPFPVSIVGPGSMFFLTSIIAIFIGLSHFNFSLLSWILLFVDFLSVVGIGSMIYYSTKQRVTRRVTDQQSA